MLTGTGPGSREVEEGRPKGVHKWVPSKVSGPSLAAALKECEARGHGIWFLGGTGRAAQGGPQVGPEQSLGTQPDRCKKV